jgi:hypothetical protein
MAKMRLLMVVVLISSNLIGAAVLAQERPQEGRDVGKTELRGQTKGEGQGPFSETLADVLKRTHKDQLLAPQAMTDLFLRLDLNHDLTLTRSELPADMPTLRARFARFDLDHDHRLTYSEFADYVDATPEEVSRLPHCTDCAAKRP